MDAWSDKAFERAKELGSVFPLKAKKRTEVPSPLYACDAPKCDGVAVVLLRFRDANRQRLCQKHMEDAERYFMETPGAEYPAVERI